MKLELCESTEGLPELLLGSRAEFSRYLDIEEDMKSWLLNGSHWLIALTAFQETGGNAEVKLNEFITGTQHHEIYASEVVNKMRDGIEALLRSDPQYASFVNDVDVSAYLDGAASSILERFKADDTITRILARFVHLRRRKRPRFRALSTAFCTGSSSHSWRTRPKKVRLQKFATQHL